MPTSIPFNIVYTDNNLPTKGTDYSIGYDVIAAAPPKIVGDTLDDIHYSSIDYIEYNTKLILQNPNFDSPYHQQLDNLHQCPIATFLCSRSSVTKYNLILKNNFGIIDPDYKNECLMRFAYLIQPQDLRMKKIYEDEGQDFNVFTCKINQNKIYRKNDKIGQLIFTPFVNVDFSHVNSVRETTRSGGFGSTDNNNKHIAEQFVLPLK